MSTPWRNPAEESLGLYPGLVVDDGRQSGSITVGQSRLPLWSFIGTALALAGALLYSARRRPIRFALDDVELTVQWPPGATLGSHCRVPRDALRRVTVTYGFELGLETAVGHVRINQAPTFADIRRMADQLNRFIDGPAIGVGP